MAGRADLHPDLGLGHHPPGARPPPCFRASPGTSDPWRRRPRTGKCSGRSRLAAIPDRRCSPSRGSGVVTEIEFFDDGAEFYTSGEIGWSPSRGERYTHNIHVTGWHSDERDDAGVPESWGLTTGANWTVGGIWMPFVRAGWSDGEAPLMNATATLGLMHYRAQRSDLIGFAMNWGDPADSMLSSSHHFLPV